MLVLVQKIPMALDLRATLSAFDGNVGTFPCRGVLASTVLAQPLSKAIGRAKLILAFISFPRFSLDWRTALSAFAFNPLYPRKTITFLAAIVIVISLCIRLVSLKLLATIIALKSNYTDAISWVIGTSPIFPSPRPLTRPITKELFAPLHEARVSVQRCIAVMALHFNLAAAPVGILFSLKLSTLPLRLAFLAAKMMRLCLDFTRPALNKISASVTRNLFGVRSFPRQIATITAKVMFTYMRWFLRKVSTAIITYNCSRHNKKPLAGVIGSVGYAEPPSKRLSNTTTKIANYQTVLRNHFYYNMTLRQGVIRRGNS